MPVFQAPIAPFPPANQTGVAVTSGVASTGNTGSSQSAARADHAHAASVDSLRAQPFVVSGTAASFDLTLYNNLEWDLPTAPIQGSESNPRDLPGRPMYYVTLSINYSTPNTLQRPSGKLIFKQPATGQITHHVRITPPAWATGGVKGLKTITPFDATGKTLAQGGTADPPFEALELVWGNADPTLAGPAFRGQIYEYDFSPLWNGSSWTLVIGAKSNMGGGGLVLQGGAPYVVGGGGQVVTNLSLEAAGNVLVNGDFSCNSGSIYYASSYFTESGVYRYRGSGTPLLNPTLPSTGIPTYYHGDYPGMIEWALPNAASVGYAFVGSYQRYFGTMVVKQPASGQQVTTLTFYYLAGTWAPHLRGITTLTNPGDPNSALSATLNAPWGTIVRDPLSPDLNPNRGFNAITIYDYQFLQDGGQSYILVRKRPGLPITAGNPAGLAQVPDATTSQSLVVDSTGQPVWQDRVPRFCSVHGIGLVNVNLAATTAPVVDGVTQPISSTYYYLLTAQSNSAQNGLWQSVTNASGVPTWNRSAWFQGGPGVLELTSAMFEMGFIVTATTSAASRLGTAWVCWLPNGGTLGTTNVLTIPLTQPASTTLSGLLSSTDKTKLDAIEAGATNTPLSSTSPVALGTSASAGSSTSASRSDHRHTHGIQPGGGLHNLATTSTHGFMSSDDKVKADQWPGLAGSGGQQLVSDSAGAPTWVQRKSVLTSDLSFGTTGSNLLVTNLTVGTWFFEFHGNYFGSGGGGNTGVGLTPTFTGTASIILSAAICDAPGTMNIFGESTTFGTRNGTSSNAPIDRAGQRYCRFTAIITVTATGTLTVKAASGAGTCNLVRGFLTQWEQVA